MKTFIGVSSTPSSTSNQVPQNPNLRLFFLGGGLVSIAVVALAFWKQWKTRKARQKSRFSTSIDWYAEEFGCDPITLDNIKKSTQTSTASLEVTEEKSTETPTTLEFESSEPLLNPTSDPANVETPSTPPIVPSQTPETEQVTLFNRTNESPSEVVASHEVNPAINLPSDRSRYIEFIEDIVASILKGKIASTELIYRHLLHELQPGTGEIFERCLIEKIADLEFQVQRESDELKQAKATRKLRAVKMLQQAWEQWQKNHQSDNECSVAVRQIIDAEASERLSVLLQILDPNQSYVFKHPQIRQLAQSLQEEAEGLTDESESFELRQYASGLLEGLTSVGELELHLISWVYELPNRALGFGEVSATYGPWKTWTKQVSSPLAKELFARQAQNQSAAFVAQAQNTIDWKAWVGLMVLMRDLQTGLVTWFDKQAYSAKAGQNLSGVTFIVFAMIWCELSTGFKTASHQPEKERLSQACFQITLQILRAFAQRDNFPFYGGVFASFSGDSFRETITYLDRPLNYVENIQEKARILTILGYSQQWMGNSKQALTFHQEALELAIQTEDRACEVANLNHLSRLNWRQQDYSQAIAFAQRALILARQIGDRKGEAHCLVSLGFCEILMARQERAVTLEQLESSMSYLEQGLKLSEKFNDFLNQALSSIGLGIAYVTVEQPTQAVPALTQGLSVVGQAGDRDLQALGYAYLGEAYYQLNQENLAVYHACIGMYLLEQRGNIQWRQVAALVMILQGKLGAEKFQKILSDYRSQLLAQIGVDGFDYLPSLIDRYRQQT